MRRGKRELKMKQQLKEQLQEEKIKKAKKPFQKH